ncbi:hypothetical protein [Comamonas squillarum]|uniref:Uncharacterized protein n=2 Tax=Comamonas TaxID=283 RepID=A0ABY6A491_9BURK|nr:hypothetical protein [Comamonas sp. PR12]UXC20523.1 hypothetical protein N4T19_10630 [Comamonas sp. PR12]
MEVIVLFEAAFLQRRQRKVKRKTHCICIGESRVSLASGSGISAHPPLARPAVVYNDQTYISNSRTVVENIHNSTHVHVVNTAPVAESARPAMTTGELPDGHGAALAAGVAAAGGYALSQRQTIDPAKMLISPGVQPMVRPSAVAPMQLLPDSHAQTTPAPAHQRPGGLTMPQPMAQPPAHGQPLEAQHTQQAQARQQQMAQQRAQQDQIHQQQMAQQRAQHEQMQQQIRAQQHAQAAQMRQQQMHQQAQSSAHPQLREGQHGERRDRQ